MAGPLRAEPPGPDGGRSCAAWSAASREALSPAASRARRPGTPTAALAQARIRRPPRHLAALQGRLPAVPFHGEHQAGILPEPKAATAVISFSATARAKAELTELFRTVTDRARFLTAGGTPPPAGIGGPAPDSGTLGPAVIPDGLTVTLGVGSTLFDDRYGLASQAAGAPDADEVVP